MLLHISNVMEILWVASMRSANRDTPLMTSRKQAKIHRVADPQGNCSCPEANEGFWFLLDFCSGATKPG
eukprot:symbB.v1.2.014962.t1/scaffold1058.1/size194011/9